MRTSWERRLQNDEVAQSAEAVEYTGRISAEGLDSQNMCPGYLIKQSDGKAPVNLELWGMRTPLYCVIAPITLIYIYIYIYIYKIWADSLKGYIFGCNKIILMQKKVRRHISLYRRILCWCFHFVDSLVWFVFMAY